MDNFGGSCYLRFEHFNGLADLTDSIFIWKAAIELAEDNHPRKPAYLNNLGVAMVARFHRLADNADLDEAIALEQSALSYMPKDHPDKPRYFSNLGCALKSRFTSLGNRADLDQAISLHQTAVNETPDGHSEKSVYQEFLGIALISLFELEGDADNLEKALSVLSEAADSPITPPMIRFRIAWELASCLDKNLRPSLDAFRYVINLLPQVAWVGIPIKDQHSHLTQIGEVVRNAVAVAIRCGDYITAVEWAEQGRSVVWQNLLGLRTPLDELRTGHPQLADRLQIISKQLEMLTHHRTISDKADAVLIGDIARRPTELAFERDNIIQKIRRNPGFEGFLKPKGFGQIAPAAYDGPVVILNVENTRCDALILTSTDSTMRVVSIKHVQLTEFSYETSKRLLRNLTDALLSAGVGARGKRQSEREGSQKDPSTILEYILNELWIYVAKPIMEGLSYKV